MARNGLAKQEEKEKARDLYKQGHTYNQITAILGVSKSSVSYWCRDLVKEEMPDITRIKVEARKKEARTLYQTGLTCSETAARLKCRHTTVQKWCKDLIEERRMTTGLRRSKVIKHKDIPNAITYNQLITPEQVIALRRQVRANPCVSLSVIARDLKVGVGTISCALRGKSFKIVNDIEPPYTGKIIPVPRPTMDFSTIDPEIVAEMIDKRRSDPFAWSYRKLMKWFNEKTGFNFHQNKVKDLLIAKDPNLASIQTPRHPLISTRSNSLAGEAFIKEMMDNRRTDPKTWTYPKLVDAFNAHTGLNYRTSHVINLFIKRDPTMRELKDAKPPVIPKPRVKKVKKVMTTQDILRKRHADAELRKAIAEANRYEDWVNAGKPDGWY